MNQYLAPYTQYCQELKNQHLWRTLPKGRSAQTDNIVNFSHNDYLGLSKHQEVIESSKEYTEMFGVGSTGSRLLSGNAEMFEIIESMIGNDLCYPAGMFLNSAFQANATIIPALLDSKIHKFKAPIIFADKLIHASIHLGINTAGLRQVRYKHLDMNHLESLLIEHKNEDLPKFIFTESVFSMDGDCVNIEEITMLAKKYNAFLYLDEAHAIGVCGENGYGIAKGFPEDIAVVAGSFSKALGSFGGFIATSNIIKEYLVNRCSGFIYTTALPPSVVGANIAAWKLIPELGALRNDIRLKSEYLRESLNKIGFNTMGSSTHIVPILTGSAECTMKLQQYLRENGVILSAIRPPSVPPNQCRLRVTVCAEHSIEQINLLIELLKLAPQTYTPGFDKKTHAGSNDDTL